MPNPRNTFELEPINTESGEITFCEVSCATHWGLYYRNDDGYAVHIEDYPLEWFWEAQTNLKRALAGEIHNWHANIAKDILIVFTEATRTNKGSTVIGTGGGIDYCMVRGLNDVDYVICDAEDAGSPDNLYAKSMVIGFPNEGEGDDKTWGDSFELFHGTCQQCIKFIAQIQGVSRSDRTWKHGF